MRIGATEIILIIVLVLLLFGGSKLSGLGKALGQSIKDFKHSLKDDDAAGDAASPAGDSSARVIESAEKDSGADSTDASATK
jgi:sec-independent protein translocase protein TatA